MSFTREDVSNTAIESSFQSHLHLRKLAVDAAKYKMMKKWGILPQKSSDAKESSSRRPIKRPPQRVITSDCEEEKSNEEDKSITVQTIHQNLCIDTLSIILTPDAHAGKLLSSSRLDTLSSLSSLNSFYNSEEPNFDTKHSCMWDVPIKTMGPESYSDLIHFAGKTFRLVLRVTDDLVTLSLGTLSFSPLASRVFCELAASADTMSELHEADLHFDKSSRQEQNLASWPRKQLLFSTCYTQLLQFQLRMYANTSSNP